MAKTIALDQNKWIEIAIAWKTQDKNIHQAVKLKKLVDLVNSGRVKFPLTFSNIYETFKIGDDNRRRELALVQSVLSRGLCFVGRYQQRQREIEKILRYNFKVIPYDENDQWYLTRRFWEAVIPTNRLIGDVPISEPHVSWVDENSSYALFSYLSETDEVTRQAAVGNFSTETAALLGRIQQRREAQRELGLSMRRRALSFSMFLENQDHFWEAVASVGLSDRAFRDCPDSFKRDLIRKVPCLFIERELALKLEAENTELTENDVRDILFMSTTLPYADVVVAEKPFAQRARQAGLDQEFSSQITSDLTDILKN